MIWAYIGVVLGVTIWTFGLFVAVACLLEKELGPAFLCVLFLETFGIIFSLGGLTVNCEPEYSYEKPLSVIKTNDVIIVNYMAESGRIYHWTYWDASYWNNEIVIKKKSGLNLLKHKLPPCYYGEIKKEANE